MIDIQELSFTESQEFISVFEFLEKPSFNGMDWVDVEDENATYIWLLEDIKKPLGFLSYKIILMPNQIDFIYIVKIYVLKTHRSKKPILIDGKRASMILFEQIYKKDINILTLESADEKLDIYYQKLGFKYNVELSKELSKVIDTRNREIMYKIDKREEIELSEVEKKFFDSHTPLKFSNSKHRS